MDQGVDLMSTLAIGDLHEKISRLQSLLKDYEHLANHVVFIGDYFDKWDGYDKDTERTVDWLKDNLYNPKYTFDWGNHDLQYGCQVGGGRFLCSGYNPKTKAYVKTRLTWDDWSRLKLVCKLNGFLFSHAGFTEETYALRNNEYLEDIQLGRYNPLFSVGKDSGGRSNYPGPLWLRWNRFRPIAQVNQVVGHTEVGKINTRFGYGTNKSINFNIDCGLREVLLIHDVDNWEILK